MDCRIEEDLIGRTRVYRWYCCNCGDGPLNYTNQGHCPECWHQRCNSLRPTSFNHQLPSKAAEQHVSFDETSAKRSRSIQISQPSYGNDTYHRSDRQPSVSSTFKLGDTHGIDPRLLLVTTPVNQSVNSITPNTTNENCPLQLGTQGVNPSSSSERMRERMRRQPQGKKKCSANPINETPDTPQDAVIDSTAGEIIVTGRNHDCVFACPFLVGNFHRHQYTKSCNRPWDLAGLREHLLGKSQSGTRNGPHILQECENCLAVFPTKSNLENHESKSQCIRQDDYPLPAEGVGKRLGTKISGLPPGPKAKGAHDELLWNSWYYTLNGDVEPPQSCYFGDLEACCNDLTLLERSKQLLEQTFLRTLPIGRQIDALKCYLKSRQEADLNELSASINKEAFERARQSLRIETICTTRKRSRNHKADEMITTKRSEAARTDTETALAQSKCAIDRLNPKSIAHEPFEATHGPAYDTSASNPGPKLILSAQQSSPMISEQPISPLDFRCSGQSTQYWWDDSLVTIRQPPLVLGGKHALLTTSSIMYPMFTNDPYDTLLPVSPNLTPNDSRQPVLSDFNASHPSKDGKYLIPAQTEVRQPGNFHGTFHEDPWNPHSIPHYGDNQPISDGFQPFEGLLQSYESDPNPPLEFGYEMIEESFD